MSLFKLKGLDHDKIWFTADQHYGHNNIRRHLRPQFKTIEDMDARLIDNYNKLVGKNDLVFIVGDLAWFKDITHLVSVLNGKLVLVEGNHDFGFQKSYGLFHKVFGGLVDLSIDGIPITLCHYAMRVWNKSHYNSWHLYGHSHGKLDVWGKSWDVGVDNNDYLPVNFTTVKEIMKDLPDNFNLIKKQNSPDIVIPRREDV